MPEFYEGSQCRYQPHAQPFLDAIARGIRDNKSCREWILKGTAFAKTYADAEALWKEQWLKRDTADSMICPFWSNYWYEPCPSCNCRIDQSISMEVDAIFFLRNAEDRTIAIHIEMKRDQEPLSVGQAEAYRPRAACFRDARRNRNTLLPHEDFVTVLFCGTGTDATLVQKHFDRVIFHNDARTIIPNYPPFARPIT